MRYTKLILSCCVLLLSCSQILAQDQSSGDIEYQRGRSEAAHDVKQGEFVIKGWGLAHTTIGNIRSSIDVYRSMLWEKYKIRSETVGGCLVDDDTLRYVAGYNEVSLAGIEAKYGKGLLEKVRKEADAEYHLKYAEQNREFMRRMIETLKTLPTKNN